MSTETVNVGTDLREGVSIPPDVDMVITLDVGAGGLDRYLALVGDRRGPRIRCLNGSLTLVSPSPLHERSTERLDAVIQTLGEELEIAFLPFDSTLLRPSGQTNVGLEPDKCYDIAHEAEARAAGDDLDLSRCPPPDLAVEVVVSHGPTRALALCKEMGIPEVWLYRPRGPRLEFLHLQGSGYKAKDHSRSFPCLKPSDLLPWLKVDPNESYIAWKRRLRAWIANELAPRRTDGETQS